MFTSETLIHAGRTFLMLFGELFGLFIGISFVVALLQIYISQERIKRVLSTPRKGVNSVLGALLGAVTPFCSCSTIPVLVGLFKSGAPFNGAISFLLTSPILNPAILTLMLAFFGLRNLKQRSLTHVVIGGVMFSEFNLPLIVAVAAVIALAIFAAVHAGGGSLDGFKTKTVGDGQHGTARWATKQEIRQTYHHVLFQPEQWRKGEKLPKTQGIVLGSAKVKGKLCALVDSDDIHCLMIGASGVGKTAYFLYPNLEYACASGMSWLALDTKGDLARNYGTIAHDFYGYHVAVIDLRNPSCSDGFNFLTLVNHYMDIDAQTDGGDLAARAKAEKYAKILAKTIVNPEGDKTDRGQNAFFYDSAEGLLAAVILLMAEFLPPVKKEGAVHERRHIASVFKVMQELLAPAPGGKNQFQLLMNLLPGEHKAKWLAGAALTAADQAMSSVISTVLSRLNAFLDSEIEQLLCFDSAINAEEFVKNKSAIFLILPEEDPVKNFIAALMIQNLSRELFAVADEHGGKLPNRAIMYCDEFGTMPPFDVLPLFSAGRSRRLTLVPIIQSLAQLEKNYGREGAEILVDNCQDTIFGGFAPQSQTAEKLSQSLGKRTVLSGYVSKGQGGASTTSQMIERPLMTPDELKSMPKGNFIIMKTGTHPAKTRLKLFLEWGITFKEPYSVPEQSKRKIYYASRKELELAIRDKFSSQKSVQVNDAEQEILKKEKKQ